MIKAVLFDIDGVLVDSREANIQYYKDLIQYAGYPPPSGNVFRDFNALPAVKVIEKMIGKNDPEEISRIRNLMEHVEYRPGLQKIMPSAQKTVSDFRRKKYKTCLVSSRIKSAVEDFIALFGNLFDTSVAFEDYSHPKPHPEPLLVALKKLSIKPEESIYIGDALTDRQAARAAGVRFIGFNNPELKDELYVEKLPDILTLITDSEA